MYMKTFFLKAIISHIFEKVLIRTKKNLLVSILQLEDFPFNIVYLVRVSPLTPSLSSSSLLSLQYLNEILHEHKQPIVSTISAADVQAAFNTIVTRIQRL